MKAILLASILGLGAASKPIYVTNYVYITNVLSVTNYVYGTVTNRVDWTNWVNITNTVNNFSYVTTTNWITNVQVMPNVFTNLVVYGTFSMCNSTPGLIQTFNGTNVTGHLP